MRLNCTWLMLWSAWGSLFLGAASARAEADPFDWPAWRGPEQNGISRETGLVDEWSPDGKNLLWKRPELATRSTPIVMNGKLYLLASNEPGTPREGEKVICADAQSGEIIWENKFNVFLTDVPKERVGWSCVAGDPATGRVYAMGVCDYFQCIDGETGETLWSHSLSEEFGCLSTYGGRTNTPVIFEDLVIISAVVIGWGEMAVPAHRLLAFDKLSGEVVWFNGTKLRPMDTTYSTPFIAVIGGRQMMVFGSGDGGVWAFQPRTGVPIWSCQFCNRGINTSPVVEGDMVYIGHSEENPADTVMGAFGAINGATRAEAGPLGMDITKSGMAWKHKEVMVGKCSPVVVDGRVYALDDGNLLYTFDATTGKKLGKAGRPTRLTGTIARASLLYADGKLFACTTSAWHVLVPTEKGLDLKKKAMVRFPQGEEIHGTPIVSHGRIYLPTTENMYCLGGREGIEPAAVERPEKPQEAPRQADEPAFVQVAPAEALIATGESIQYKARVFNAAGQLIGDAADPSFDVSGGGEIDSQGLFKATEGTQAAAATVSVKVGELLGKARVRIAPPLNWTFDFDDGQVPVTWVGCRYRHITLDDDLLQSLNDRNERAGRMYIYLMSSFVNGPKPDAAHFDDRTPRRTWTDLLRYFDLDTSVKTEDDARRELGEALDLLKEENVLAEWSLNSKGPNDVALDVKRGPRQVDGNAVMVKISTIPKGTRSQGWMGRPDLRDYTIQADLRGSVRNGKQPDMGLIAQRYTLVLLGNAQELRIQSWTPELARFSKTVSFPWKPNVWYTAKFRAAVEDGKAVLKGKVWPRGEDEPGEWTVEAVDEAANLTGSPGLFGNASDAEVFLDNITVTANDQ
ncbi:MAG TPA: PQQ-binding-like beta-propeller repeat protein [Pirellulales bacterium]|nr:PQQ-binding-like beta-propeller repeat protein [Pirellulales bacterium]